MTTNDVSNMRPPDYFNATRQAWRGRDLDGDPPSRPSLMRIWLVNAPGVHACWSRWIVAAYDLGNYPGIPPAKLVRPGMTHEFCSAAVDPRAALDLSDPVDWLRNTLRPFDLLVQVGGISDDQAERILEKFVQACVIGQTHPDVDYRTRNERLITLTAAHLAGGQHEVN